MEGAKEKDKKPRKLQRHEDPSSKIIEFHIMKDLTDPQPTIVRQVLNNDSKLQEILWNFSRFPLDSRLTLSQNPHFYDHLPPSSNANWGELNANATQENWHTYHTKPICVLTNAPSRVFLELCGNPRAFDNVWNADETLIFKSVCGRLEGEDIVGASIQHSLYSWCHVEHLASEPGIAAVLPSQISPLNNCVSVKKWIYELRQVLLSQSHPNVKIRISKCTEPTRGCCCNDSDEGSTESLECPEGDSSLTRGEWTGEHGIVGTDEGNTESLERLEGASSPTQGEQTRGNGIAGSDDGNMESLKRHEGFSSPTRREWTGAHGVVALLVCLLGILVYYLSSSA